MSFNIIIIHSPFVYFMYDLSSNCRIKCVCMHMTLFVSYEFLIPGILRHHSKKCVSIFVR